MDLKEDHYLKMFQLYIKCMHYGRLQSILVVKTTKSLNVLKKGIHNGELYDTDFTGGVNNGRFENMQ